MYFPDRRESGIFTGVVATITHLVNRLQRWGRRDGLFLTILSVFSGVKLPVAGVSLPATPCSWIV